MSIKIMTWVFECSQTQGAERLVLLALADNASDEGYCWPSLVTIARKAHVSRRSTIRAINRLVDRGMLIRLRRFDGERMMNHTNRYRVIWPGSSVQRAGGVVTQSHQGGDTESLGVVTQSHQGGDTESPKSSINLHSEPSINPLLPTSYAVAHSQEEGAAAFERGRELLEEIGVYPDRIAPVLAAAEARGWTDEQLADLAVRLRDEFGPKRAASLVRYRIEHEDPAQYGYARYSLWPDSLTPCPTCGALSCDCDDEEDYDDTDD